VNFGVPGGLGPAGLVAYARNAFGVEMTLEQAQAFRTRLITEIYPELGRCLAEDGMAVLARNLGVPVEELWGAFDPTGSHEGLVAGDIRNVLRGKLTNAKSRPYSRGYLDRVWGTPARLCRDPELKRVLGQRHGSEALADRRFGAAVVTLTGRIRAGVDYCQCRNTPFQGLASDGAKQALWRLLREGFRVVGFVHDEVLVELPDEGGSVPLAAVERVKAVLCEEMAAVLVGEIPVECEAALATCWSKDAAPVVAGDRMLAWSPAA
jgi:hypothetical protein